MTVQTGAATTSEVLNVGGAKTTDVVGRRLAEVTATSTPFG